MVENNLLVKILEGTASAIGIGYIVKMIKDSISKKLSTIATKKEVENIDKKIDRIEEELKEDIKQQIEFVEKTQAITNKSVNERLKEISKIVPNSQQ